MLTNNEQEGAVGGRSAWRFAGASANPFHERSLVEAALRHLAGPREQVHLLGGNRPWEPALPLSKVMDTPLGAVWTVWSHVHALDTTPGDTEDSPLLLDRLFGFLRGQGASMLRWATLPADTSFYKVLTHWLEDSGLEFHVTKRIERPVLEAGRNGAETAFNDWVGGKRAREFRRCRRRLEELGKLSLRIIDGQHDARQWIGDFFEIEQSGWKGARGTALACKAAERRWFEAVTSRAATEGRALVYSLELDSMPIAISVNYRVGGKVWCFKTAYSAELSRHAPGALLEYESTLAAIADPDIEWLDACTIDDSGLMGALWRDRRPVVDLIIATRRSANLPTGAVAFGWRSYLAAKRHGIALARRVRNRGQTRP
ncbi:MAG: GNAT family N-acetyltransferase [Rhizobiaceae bacterium]|nr:GNAT family N-acetyltransferase [Rhizobiaceae bacterium]